MFVFDADGEFPLAFSVMHDATPRFLQLNLFIGLHLRTKETDLNLL